MAFERRVPDSDSFPCPSPHHHQGRGCHSVSSWMASGSYVVGNPPCCFCPRPCCCRLTPNYRQHALFGAVGHYYVLGIDPSLCLFRHRLQVGGCRSAFSWTASRSSHVVGSRPCCFCPRPCCNCLPPNYPPHVLFGAVGHHQILGIDSPPRLSRRRHQSRGCRSVLFSPVCLYRVPAENRMSRSPQPLKIVSFHAGSSIW